MIRKDCYWYRPWENINGIIDQCYFHELGECHCSLNCDNFTSQETADTATYFYMEYASVIEEMAKTLKTSE